ncbi:MAG: hypothetical protein ACKVQK_16640 [Burkholderiales bacterium]
MCVPYAANVHGSVRENFKRSRWYQFVTTACFRATEGGETAYASALVAVREDGCDELRQQTVL